MLEHSIEGPLCPLVRIIGLGIIAHRILNISRLVHQLDAFRLSESSSWIYLNQMPYFFFQTAGQTLNNTLIRLPCLA